MFVFLAVFQWLKLSVVYTERHFLWRRNVGSAPCARRVATTRAPETCALPLPLARSSSHALRAPAQSRVHTLALRRSSQKELFFLTAFILERRIFPPTVRLNRHKNPQILYIYSGGNAYVHEQGKGHTGWFGKPDTFGWEIYPNMFEKKKLSNILNGELFFDER